MILTAIFILCAFIIGFLLGENRAVKQANAILDHNQRVLLDAFKDVPVVTDDEPIRPHLH